MIRCSRLAPSLVGLVAASLGALAWAGCKSTTESPPAQARPPAVAADEDEEEVDEDGKDSIEAPTSTPPPKAEVVTAIPTTIRYVLVVIKENHTFDNYFTGFPGADTSMTAKLSDGATIDRKVAPTELMKDLCHTNACGQKAYAGGKMNGFDKRDPERPFYRYTEQQIPNYWEYARNFVLADHLFSTTLGPSTPGHTVFWAGQSLVLDNAKCEKPGGACAGRGCNAGADIKITSYDPDTCSTERVSPCFDVPSLSDHLPKGFTWTDYGGSIAEMIKSVAKEPDYKKHFRKQAQLVADLEAGHLANLTIAHLWGGDESEHPAADPCVGENFTVDIVNAAMKLPQWKEMAIVVTWDDWGGWYDHVKPPVHKCKNGKIFRAGFRVPAIVISPFAKKGHVLKTPLEQASIPRLVEELWGMDFMTKRDPHARDGEVGSMMEAFDFKQTPRQPLVLTKRTCPVAPPRAKH